MSCVSPNYNSTTNIKNFNSETTDDITTDAQLHSYTKTFYCTLCNDKTVTDIDFHMMDEHFQYYEYDKESNLKYFVDSESNTTNVDETFICTLCNNFTCLKRDNNSAEAHILLDHDTHYIYENTEENLKYFTPLTNTIRDTNPSATTHTDDCADTVFSPTTVEILDTELYHCPSAQCNGSSFTESQLTDHFNFHFRSDYYRVNSMKLFLCLINIVPKIKYSRTMQSHGLFLFHYALKNFNEYNDKSLSEQELEILFNNHFKSDHEKINFMKLFIKHANKSTKPMLTPMPDARVIHNDQFNLASPQNNQNESIDLSISQSNETFDLSKADKENGHINSGNTESSNNDIGTYLADPHKDSSQINVSPEEQTSKISMISNSIIKQKRAIFKCNICHAEFIHKVNLNRHLQTPSCIKMHMLHNSEQIDLALPQSEHPPLQNSKSNKSTKWISQEFSIVWEQNARYFKCNSCAQMFKNKCNINQHLRNKFCLKHLDCLECSFLHRKLHKVSSENGNKSQTPFCKWCFLLHKNYHRYDFQTKQFVKNSKPIVTDSN